MSRFLQRMAERSLGVEQAATPIVPSFFADWRTATVGAPPSVEPGHETGMEIVVTETTAPARNLEVAAVRKHAPPAPGLEPAVRVESRAAAPPDPRPTRIIPAASLEDSGSEDDVPRLAVPAQPARRETSVPIRERRERSVGPRHEGAMTLARDVPVPPVPPTRRAARVPPDRGEAVSPSVNGPTLVPPLAAPRPSVAARRTVLAPAASPSMSIEGIVRPRRAAAGDALPRRQGRDQVRLLTGAEERVVEISIGRIEVRALPGETAQPRATPERRGLSLEAYLRGREARA